MISNSHALLRNWSAVACGSLALMLSGFVAGASADEYGSIKDTPVLSSDAWAGHWFVRARAAYVMPDSHLDSVTVNPGSALKPAGGEVPGADDSISGRWIPEIDISYFLTNNWAIETICCVTQHTASGRGSLAPLGEAISSYVVPVSLLLQYHADLGGGWRPYIGAGPVFAFFVDPQVGDGVYALDHKAKAGIDPFAFGGVAQAGIDIPLHGNWYANFDVKKYLLRADADIDAPGLTTQLHVNSFHFDPWIFGVGIGYKF